MLKYKFIRFSSILRHPIQQSYLPLRGSKGLIALQGLASGLAVGVLTAFRVERWSVGWFCYQTAERLPRRMSRVTLDFSSLPRRRRAFSLPAARAPPSPASPQKHAAFMPHYRRFETRHGRPMSFFIALLLAARFTEPARRASQKVPRRFHKKPPTVLLELPLTRQLSATRLQPSSFLSKKLSLNSKAPR